MRFFDRLNLCWRILRAKSGGLLRHAELELPHIGTDDMGAMMAGNLRELVLVFGTQGHSGFSASFARDALEKLLSYKPLAPLTGEPDEWMEVGPSVFQNRRCSRVFRQADRFNGQAYDLDGKVFREPSGACYTSSESLVPITFPYWPKTEYVDVPESA
jgi:hypothetical protein